jgi:hypothetical protein
MERMEIRIKKTAGQTHPRKHLTATGYASLAVRRRFIFFGLGVFVFFHAGHELSPSFLLEFL